MPILLGMTRVTHGPAIRALREALGIPHGVFAVEVGISPGYLSHIERDQKRPRPQIARAIADRLGVPLDAITCPAPASEKDAA